MYLIWKEKNNMMGMLSQPFSNLYELKVGKYTETLKKNYRETRRRRCRTTMKCHGVIKRMGEAEGPERA